MVWAYGLYQRAENSHYSFFHFLISQMYYLNNLIIFYFSHKYLINFASIKTQKLLELNNFFKKKL